jgi:hypothetical protein
MVTQGRITGTVTDSTTHAPLAGICVDLFDTSGTIVASVDTDTSGAYTMPPSAAGSYYVGFFNCGGSTYTAQYYNGKASLASADSVTITDGTTTSGIAAAMVAVPTTTPTATATAVGYYYDSAGNEQALSEAWNGNAWVRSSSSPAGARSSYLNSVSCTAATPWIGVGYYYDSAGNEQALLEARNGSARAQSSSSPATSTALS